jgi:hypothetical protein
MKRKIIHPMEGKVSFYRMNAFYISLLTMKSSMTFGTVYKARQFLKNDSSNVNWKKNKICQSSESRSRNCNGTRIRLQLYSTAQKYANWYLEKIPEKNY